MHYLKCAHCSHYNLLKTEYLTFCEHCGKKLDNNYPDWLRKNPGKNFDDFRRLVCTTEIISAAPAGKSMHKPREKKQTVIILIVIVLVLCVASVSLIFGPRLVKQAREYVLSMDIFKVEWVKGTYGNFGLSLETPAMMRETRVELPPEAQMMIAEMTIHEYLSPGGMQVYATSALYKPEVGAANIRGAADGAIANAQAQPGVANFDYSETPFGKSGVPGVMIKGTSTENGKEMEFVFIILCKDLNLWQLTIVYPKDDEKLRKDAQRMIDSMEINYEPGQKQA